MYSFNDDVHDAIPSSYYTFNNIHEYQCIFLSNILQKYALTNKNWTKEMLHMMWSFFGEEYWFIQVTIYFLTIPS